LPDALDRRRIGIGGDEDHRHRPIGQDSLRRADAVDSVGKAHIHQHEVRLQPRCLFDGAAAGGDGARHLMAELLNHRAQRHGDDRLILDDQDAQRRLAARSRLGMRALPRLRTAFAIASGTDQGAGSAGCGDAGDRRPLRPPAPAVITGGMA
jgi:hypothetical protein